jgi:signal transduction histidine kinase
MGVPKENVDQIFNPFFTTKSEGEGTGLGLSITFNIVKEHGGTIHVETKEGVGTGFYIRLPIKQDETLDVNIEHSVKNITK